MSAELPMGKLTKIYVRIRNAAAELTRKYEAELAELDEQKKAVANEMKDQMKAAGVTSMKTDFGLVMLGQRTRYWTGDWESFEAFCLEQKTIGFLEKRVAQKNMADFIAKNPESIPPGLNSDTEYVVTVRKPT